MYSWGLKPESSHSSTYLFTVTNAKYVISSEFENIPISEHRIQSLLLRFANIYSLINGFKKNVLKNKFP